MITIDLVPNPYTGGVRTLDAEYDFNTIDDLRIELWKARIDPDRNKQYLSALRRGNVVRIPVTEKQRQTFYRRGRDRQPRFIPRIAHPRP